MQRISPNFLQGDFIQATPTSPQDSSLQYFQAEFEGRMPAVMEVYTAVSTPEDPYFTANAMTQGQNNLMFNTATDAQDAHFRSRHDSYSSQIYSPAGPSSGAGMLINNNTNDTIFDHSAENSMTMSHPAPDQSMDSMDEGGAAPRGAKKGPKGKGAPCMTKNAVLARQNRQRKKEETQNMGAQIERLTAECQAKDETIEELRAELAKERNQKNYYMSLLQNSKEIKYILGQMDHNKVFPEH